CVLMMRAGVSPSPGQYARPRFTRSQQATERAAGSCFGLCCHRMWPGSFRSSANVLLGNDVWTYMTPLTTSGVPSCPCSRPVENDQAARSCFTFSVLICVLGL